MVRFLTPLLLCIVFAFSCVTISAQGLLFSGDFEAGLTGWQLKHLRPNDGIRCTADNCYFKWSKVTTDENRTLQATVNVSGQAGQYVRLTGDFTVRPGAVLFLRVTVDDNKTRCKRIIRPTTGRLNSFTCMTPSGSDFSRVRVKISTHGGGRVEVDNVRISVN